MKRFATVLALSTGLITGPALAGHEGGNIPNKKNVGGAVGGDVVGKNVAHSYQGGASAQRASHKRGRHKSDRHRSSKRSHYRKHQRRGSHTSHKPKIHPIREFYVARTRSNVRSGPSTRFRVIDHLHNHERVRVVGKVHGRDWYMVRARHGKGFVYAPLLRPAHGGHHGYKRHDKHDRGGYRSYRRH